jgi:1-pyrroline-5-carboxylate dehydrogenase
MPHDHSKNLCTYEAATPEMIDGAIKSTLAAQKEWESLPWNDRAAIFLKAADLVAGKYRCVDSSFVSRLR